MTTTATTSAALVLAEPAFSGQERLALAGFRASAAQGSRSGGPWTLAGRVVAEVPDADVARLARSAADPQGHLVASCLEPQTRSFRRSFSL